MISKLGSLSLGLGVRLLLIALLNAQLMQAHSQPHRPHGDQTNSGEGWGHMRHHHDHGLHHGHGHHYQNRYPDSYPAAGQGSRYGEGSYGGGQQRGGYGGPGYGNGRPGAGYGAQPLPGYGRQQPGNGLQQPGNGYGHQLPGSGYGHGADSGNDDWPSGLANVGHQPRPEYDNEQSGNPIQPRPHHGGRNPTGYDFQQHGNDGNPLQPRPGVGSSNPNDFQQPGNPISQQGGGHPTEYDFQQPGNAGNPLQPRPGVGLSNPNEFQQPGSPIQPRPHQGGRDPAEYDFQQPGNAGNPLQPRPGVGTNDPNAFQQSGQSGNPLQPRPIPFQPLEESGTLYPSQPFPGQQQPGDQHVDNTFQPRPAAGGSFSSPGSNPHSAVDDNIAAIFNTDNFMAPNVGKDKELHGSGDHKAQAEGVQPDYVGERNLFSTMPQCTNGFEVRAGRCRLKA